MGGGGKAEWSQQKERKSPERAPLSRTTLRSAPLYSSPLPPSRPEVPGADGTDHRRGAHARRPRRERPRRGQAIKDLEGYFPLSLLTHRCFPYRPGRWGRHRPENRAPARKSDRRIDRVDPLASRCTDGVVLARALSVKVGPAAAARVRPTPGTAAAAGRGMEATDPGVPDMSPDFLLGPGYAPNSPPPYQHGFSRVTFLSVVPTRSAPGGTQEPGGRPSSASRPHAQPRRQPFTPTSLALLPCPSGQQRGRRRAHPPVGGSVAGRKERRWGSRVRAVPAPSVPDRWLDPAPGAAARVDAVPLSGVARMSPPHRVPGNTAQPYIPEMALQAQISLNPPLRTMS